MKVFYLRSQMFFLIESALSDSSYIIFYEKFFQQFLDFRNVSEKKYCEVINVGANKKYTKPFHLQKVLRKDGLFPFVFLLYKN
jgi:hypothetical protein